MAKLFNEHLETAFKLTTRSETHYKNRAYQWLEAIVDVTPQSFWDARKRRVVKSIYTHAVDMAKINPSQTQELEKEKVLAQAREPFKEYALKIALKFISITKKRQDTKEYKTAIRSNLIQMLAEDPRENFRRLIVEKMDFGKKAIYTQFLARKTLDQSTAVRLAAYRRLFKDRIELDSFREHDRLILISNGLRDHDQAVLESCRVYLVQQFCLKPEFRDVDLEAEQLREDMLCPLEYMIPKLNLL